MRRAPKWSRLIACWCSSVRMESSSRCGACRFHAAGVPTWNGPCPTPSWLMAAGSGGSATPVAFREHRYVAAVMAPLEELEEEQAELTAALADRRIAGLAGGRRGWLDRRPSDLEAARRDGRAGDGDYRARPNGPTDGAEQPRRARPVRRIVQRAAGSPRPAVLHSQRQFMADASHELRTPVSVVRTTAQVTLAQGQSRRGRLSRIVHDCRRAGDAARASGRCDVPALESRGERAAARARAALCRRPGRRLCARIAHPRRGARRDRSR